jgi:hypothetical protein
MKKAAPAREAAQTNHDKHTKKKSFSVGGVFHIVPSTFKASVPVKTAPYSLFLNFVLLLAGLKHFRWNGAPRVGPSEGFKFFLFHVMMILKYVLMNGSPIFTYRRTGVLKINTMNFNSKANKVSER